MSKILKFKTNLMMREKCVCSFVIELSEELLAVSDLRIIDTALLPTQMQQSFYGWLISRIMPSKTRHYINMMSVVFQYKANRLPYSQLALSLETNCASLSDHYWLNPEDNMVLEHMGKKINFKQKEWKDVRVWDVATWNSDLDAIMFHDMLFVTPDVAKQKTKNPIWTTNGETQKRWMYNDGEWYLEKRLGTNKIQDEIRCFECFEEHNILTPEYQLLHYDVSDKYMFTPTTISAGFDVVKKKCLSSPQHYLLPLKYFVKQANVNDLKSLLCDISKYTHINSTVLCEFEDAITKYIKEENYSQLDTGNLGFLVDCNNNAVPAVWSNVGTKGDSLF